MTTAAELASYASSFPSFRNRIINGDMRIDQRNAGASVTFDGTNKFVTDRFYGFSNVGTTTSQQSTTAPTGFNNSLLVTQSTGGSVVSSSYLALNHRIEGFNFADLGWGSASAKTITLSFWVRSSITGTFSVAFINSAANRSYVTNYSISAADTWEQKTITIAGDTSGTWVTNNGIGVTIVWNLGYGSNYTTSTLDAWAASAKYGSTTTTTSFASTTGATFYITGVQLEEGTVATPFEHRPIGTELALCQRYYEKSHEIDDAPGTLTTDSAVFFRSIAQNTTYLAITDSMRVEKRASPTIVVYDINGNSGKICINDSITDPCNISTFSVSSYGKNIRLIYDYGSKSINGMSFNWVATAEL